MKMKEKSVVSKNELAKYLQNTAKNILDNGDVTIAGNKIDLPDKIELALKSKEKEGRRKIKIEIKWDDFEVDDYDGKDKITAAKVSSKTFIGIPSNFKAIKKDMEKKLFEIERSLKNNQTPQKQEMQYFLNLIQAFKNRSKPEWLSSVNELQTSVAALNGAVSENNHSLALIKIAEIRNLKEKYHKQFK